jgi:hypothetical protein
LKKSSLTEADIERYLREQIEARGGLCVKFKDPARRGAPDRIVMLPGLPVHFVETKCTKFGRVASHQARYHRDLNRLGHEVYLLWSKEDVDRFLDGIELLS